MKIKAMTDATGGITKTQIEVPIKGSGGDELMHMVEHLVDNEIERASLDKESKGE